MVALALAFLVLIGAFTPDDSSVHHDAVALAQRLGAPSVAICLMEKGHRTAD